MSKSPYTLHTRMGMTIRMLDDEDPWDAACYMVGSDNLDDLEVATEQDVRHVRAMGGKVPKEALEKFKLKTGR